MLKAVLDALVANVFPKLEKSLSEKRVEGFYSYFPDYEVITTKRIAAFIAQAAHGTGGFKWFYELGRESYFNKYERINYTYFYKKKETIKVKNL